MKQMTTMVALLATTAVAQGQHIFVPNQGQLTSTASSAVTRSYYAHVPGGTVYFAEDTVSFVLVRMDDDTATVDTFYRFDMRFIQPYSTPAFRASDTSDYYFNFYYPHCDTGITGVRYFAQLDINDLWQGIDLSYEATGSDYITRFTIAPEHGLNNIKWQFDGLDSAVIGLLGELQLHTPLGPVFLPPPIAYSGNDTFSVSYTRTGSNFGFQTEQWTGLAPMYVEYGARRDGPRNHQENVEWSTFIKPTSKYGYGLDVDIDDSYGIYMCGMTENDSFPVNLRYNPNYDRTSAYVLKFNESNELIWGTLIGSQFPTKAVSVSANDPDYVYITGECGPGLPVVSSGAQYSQAAARIFVARLRKLAGPGNIPPAGTLDWCTYYGGNWSGEESKSIYVEPNNRAVYVSGTTGGSNPNFPLLSGGLFYIDSTETGFVLSFDEVGIRTWASRFGAPGVHTVVHDILPVGLNLYLCGESAYSPDFPLPPGYYPQSYIQDSTYGGGIVDAFVACYIYHPGISWCTYLGGSDQERAFSLDRNSQGHIYVTGETNSTDFPVKASAQSGAYIDSIKNSSFDIFIARFGGNFEQLWTTYYGSWVWDLGVEVQVDPLDRVFVYAQSYNGAFNDLPVYAAQGVFLQTGGTTSDLFNKCAILLFDDTDNRLWATLFFGAHNDAAGGCALLGDQKLYIVGASHSAYEYTDPNKTGWPDEAGPPGSYYDPLPINVEPELTPFISKFAVDPWTISAIREAEHKQDVFTSWWYHGSDGTLWLHLGHDVSGVGELVVYDVLGRTMQTEKVHIVDGRTQLRLRQLPQGTYLVSAQTAGTMQTFKVPVLR